MERGGKEKQPYVPTNKKCRGGDWGKKMGKGLKKMGTVDFVGGKGKTLGRGNPSGTGEKN